VWPSVVGRSKFGHQGPNPQIRHARGRRRRGRSSGCSCVAGGGLFGEVIIAISIHLPRNALHDGGALGDGERGRRRWGWRSWRRWLEAAGAAVRAAALVLGEVAALVEAAALVDGGGGARGWGV
jgi:hypothetical protein